MAIIRARGPKNGKSLDGVVPAKKPAAATVKAAPKLKAPVYQEPTSTKAGSYHYSLAGEESETIRGKWDTGMGFLLRKNQWIDNGCISENVETEDGVFHKCTTPPIPTDLTKVYGYGKTREEQVWDRSAIMKDPDHNPSFMDERLIEKKLERGIGKIKSYKLDRRQEMWVQKEEDRIWINGFWLFIDGVLTWLHGAHYLELKYWPIGAKTNDGYKDFRDLDRRWYMDWRRIELSDLIIGQIHPKARRIGATERGMCLLFYYGRRENKGKCGFIMDDGKKTQGKFTMSFITPYNTLPLWLRGRDVIDVNSASVLESWKNPTTGKLEGTGSLINWKTTTEQAYNGDKLIFGLFDEGGKYKIDLSVFWNSTHKMCFMLGALSDKCGHAYFPTTIEEMEHGSQYATLVENSKWSTYDTTLGQTLSGMSLFFRSSEDGLENFTDPWGDSIIDDPKDPYIIQWRVTKGHKFPEMGSARYIQTRLDHFSKHNEWDLYTRFLRAHPRKLEDMFVNKSGQNGFNGEKLQRLITNLQSSASRTNFNRRGDLHWVNPSDWSKGCYWEDNDDNGSFLTNRTWSNWELQANNCEWDFRGKTPQGKPLNTHLGVNTVDPYAKGILIDQESGSKGAAHGLAFFDFHEERTRWNSGIPGKQRSNYRRTPSLFFQYHEHPLEIDDFYEDMAKACVYWGIEMAHENNWDGISEYFKRHGLEGFLVDANEFFPEEEQTRSRMGTYGFRMDVDAPKHLQAVSRFVSGRDRYLQGYSYDIDNPECLEYIPFLLTAQQLHSFNLAKRTKFDLVMSLVPGLILMEQRLYKQIFSEPNRPQTDPDTGEEWMDWEEQFSQVA